MYKTRTNSLLNVNVKRQPNKIGF